LSAAVKELLKCDSLPTLCSNEKWSSFFDSQCVFSIHHTTGKNRKKENNISQNELNQARINVTKD